MALLELIRKPKQKPTTRLDYMFVPVIFANGRDDDLPGLTAAIENKRVQFDEKVYKPGESLEIVGRELAFSCSGIYIIGAGYEPTRELYPREVLIREGNPSRPVLIKNCYFRYDIDAEPC